LVIQFAFQIRMRIIYFRSLFEICFSMSDVSRDIRGLINDLNSMMKDVSWSVVLFGSCRMWATTQGACGGLASIFLAWWRVMGITPANTSGVVVAVSVFMAIGLTAKTLGDVFSGTRSLDFYFWVECLWSTSGLKAQRA